MFYAGIGSRSTPTDFCTLMTRFAAYAASHEYVLRSGAATGADAAFEAGAGDLSEIWLPWPGFNSHESKLFPTTAAFDLAARFHPAWNRCSPGARKLHARNCHQILGADLDTPSRFVLCWTPGGSGSGGTGQALRLAAAHSIPIFDLGRYPTAEIARSPLKHWLLTL